MQFIDTTTPKSAQEYIDIGKNYAGISDMSRELATNWATMYYQNAYNTAMQNYMNEYNSPRMQMLRYQEAGINPYGANIEGGNMSSTHPGAAPKGNFTAPSNLDKLNTSLNAVKSVSDLVKTARETYDYLKFGAPEHEMQNKMLQYDLPKHMAESDWSLYWNYGSGFGPNSPYVEGSPRAQYMANSTEYKARQISQLDSLIKSVYPNQAAAQKASAALNDYKKQVMEGRNEAVLNIDTGYPTLDSFLRFIAYMFQDGRFF